jgi:NAD(P)-dependent dehydrogenase (short-subunit alcohol dehydrogenase family)
MATGHTDSATGTMPAASGFRLDGQVAIITGGSKGIGRAIAETFASAGASVVVCARGEALIDETVSGIEAAGGRALGVSADATDAAGMQEVVDRAVEAFGTVDILVNNAGAAPFMSTIDSIRADGFEKYFRINFWSAVTGIRAVAPVLIAKQAGAVLNMASVAAFIANPGLSYYGTAKAAVVNLTKTVSREWAGYGIRVNALAPGWIETEMNAGARQSPEFLRTTLASIPLGRWGRPADVASAALYLCSPAAAWVTGSVLVIDGGQTTTALGGMA